jgi:hypothetical protein
MNEIRFYDIRIFAVNFFYAWEDGVDFNWLRKEWPKFKPHFANQNEAEDFVLVLAYIYSVFCVESYFEKSCDSILTIQEYVNETAPDHLEFTDRISNKIDVTLDLLLQIYIHPSEFLRELASIAIDFELPNQEGYKYILGLFKDKYNEPEHLVPEF